ncbi:hypothetical protein A1Q1_02465 [Trichosporon asahii var. asahii CBS 2479]|uniref:Isochorismatase-like domain-containing protein n=1 Tax=Trichosporon asahii var. asahii (strain ATCC 90039 / CBS 2479 / JCM 2466 / KCTC 7840 / NBRC 103889/ NCYC 2677 / UAMH 7654) TaxID=1186058 RepID=J6F0A6_TRIAS|nr:hypothetical protein A1Q1_02465 [Trichosporon asahii var. asahii CBS 2479]EJT48557.1 hypothetical protein A1Q1_02465 [Trichosporon asahii var. asahii CBS 2479]
MSEAKSFRQLAGVPPSTASTKDSVLVIIDAQNEYAQGALKIKNVEASRKNIEDLLEKYRKDGGQVIHVVHQVPEGTPVFTPGTELAEEFAELKPTGNEAVVKKIHPGSFAETNLDSLLQKGGIKRLVLVGYMSHVCVSTTARQAAQRGYDVLVVEDAIGDRDVPGASAEQLVQTVCAELGDAFGTIIKTAEVKNA